MKYSVYGRVVGSKFMGVYEADCKEEAIDKALDAEGGISLCWQCAKEIDDPEIDDITAELEDES